MSASPAAISRRPFTSSPIPRHPALVRACAPAHATRPSFLAPFLLWLWIRARRGQRRTWRPLLLELTRRLRLPPFGRQASEFYLERASLMLRASRDGVWIASAASGVGVGAAAFLLMPAPWPALISATLAFAYCRA